MSHHRSFHHVLAAFMLAAVCFFSAPHALHAADYGSYTSTTGAVKGHPAVAPQYMPSQGNHAGSDANAPSARPARTHVDGGTAGLEGTAQARPAGEGAPEEPSAFEAHVNEMLGSRLDAEGASATGLDENGEPSEVAPGFGLRQYGYGLFTTGPDSFAPVEDVPVGPDYLIGPGDVLMISLWGKVFAEYSVQVGRDGSVTVPQLGVMHVAGMSFAEAREFLQNELGRYYKPAEVRMNIGMGPLRSIRVFVVGKARRPGSYTLSSLSTLVTSLFSSGGPAKVGSMRDIQVKRGGRTVVHFDLYDFLLKGDKSKDIRLMPEDVVYIPPAGPLVAVAGSVRSPGIYELKGETTMDEVISLAGGFNDIAFRGRLQVTRIIDNNRETMSEYDIDGIGTSSIEVHPGDIVRAFNVVDDVRVVRLAGAVQREGSYGIARGMTVSQIIGMAGGLKFYAFKGNAELTRVVPTPQGPETTKINIDLEKALEKDPVNDIALQEDDYIFIRSVPEWDLYKTVKISGEVRFPGTYTVKKSETISSLIDRAGGFTDKAYLKGAEFVRASVRDLQQKQLDSAINRLETSLLSGSAQTIEASLSPEDARQQQAAFEQRSSLIGKMRSVKAKGRIAIRLARLDEFTGTPSDLVLEDGDELSIPETPSQVQVMGSVYNQTAFVYDPKSGVSDYLARAGGMTADADKKEVYVLKVDGTAVSRRNSSGWGVNWDSNGRQWVGGGLMSRHLDPGDTIVVPEKLEKLAWLKETKDITQILYQIAVTAGVLIVAF